MSIMVTQTVPASFEACVAVIEAHPEWMSTFMEASEKYGVKGHGHLLGDNKFIGLSEFPDREAYANFQSAMRDVLEKLDEELGVTTVEEVWEFDPPQQA